MLLDIREMKSDPPELIERFRRGIKFDVFLDGKVVPFAFHADTVAGLVKAYLPDETGQLRTCTDHTVVGETQFTGKVEIKRRPFAGDRGSGDRHIAGPKAEASPETEIAGARTKTVYGG